tara:strand:+ start:310 stop:1029 length:720 start_codon:yes stop_codon:yes gene_type:complete
MKKIFLKIKKFYKYLQFLEEHRIKAMIKSGRGFWVILILLSSCTKEEINPTPCNGDCETSYEVIYKNQLLAPNGNGYYEIEWDNLNYFQISGYLTPLNSEYEINNVPLVEARFDSDYWVVLDSLTFQTPMYSYLGWFNDNTLNNPIPVGNYDITLSDMIELHPPFNVVGYQIPRYFCVECPYATTLLGTYSKHTYEPTQNIFVDNEMVGDTINVFIQTVFNTDMGESEIIEDQIKVIIL